jgi:hypothetical protein
MNDRLMDIISLKNRLLPGPLDAKLQPLFYMSLYDLDGFRSQIIGKGLSEYDEIQPETFERIKNDDLILLKFSFDWIRQALVKT